jgi:flagellar biosynthesis/type III secretory pathway chaperone
MLEQNITLTDCREENSCETDFITLIEVLKKELAIYQELKSFIIDEKKILIRPSFEELNESNARKENIILKARMLEEARTNILKKIARNLELKADETKLATVAGYTEIEQRQKIEEIRKKIVLISGEIRSLNERNKDLVGSTLNNVKGSLDFISSVMSQGPVYLESGKIKSFQSNGKFLRTQG